MKSKPISSMPGNSATLHIRTPRTNGIVSYTVGSQLSEARPGPVLPNWETISQWRLGSLVEAVEEGKPRACAGPPEEATTFYLITATPSVLLLTLMTVWLKELCHWLTPRVWQGLDEQQRNADGRHARLSHGDVKIVWRGILSSYARRLWVRDKNVRGTGMAQFTR